MDGEGILGDVGGSRSAWDGGVGWDHMGNEEMEGYPLHHISICLYGMGKVMYPRHVYASLFNLQERKTEK